MRVYEIAKEFGVSSKDALIILNKLGFSFSSHMSFMTDESINSFRKKFSSEKSVKFSKDAKQVPDVPSHDVKKTVEVKKTEEALVTPDQQSTKKVFPKKSDYVAEPVDFGKDELVFQDRILGQEKISKIIWKKGFGDRFGGPGRHLVRKRKRKTHAIEKPEVHEPVGEISIDSSLPLFEVATLMGKTSGELILLLLKRGVVCNRNHVLATDIIEDLGKQFGISVKVKRPKYEESESLSQSEKIIVENISKNANIISRWPVVVIMGHVDHGKTTLLDYIRKMNVAATEKGGITQHIGAYDVESKHGKIVFLDTPGHEAFSYLRERGTRITDLAVLVIAVDDGIKPQTVEAIKHAKDAQVPVIVAINKIDKVALPNALEAVKRQLAQYDLMPEDWGGSTVVVPISAKTGQGVDELLEMIVLQAQLMELKANIGVPARAFVLESKIEKGLGYVATVICVEGILKQGDCFIYGTGTGKVRLLITLQGDRVLQVGPASPVQVVGFDDFAAIGDWLTVVSHDEYLKTRSQNVRDIVTPEAESKKIIEYSEGQANNKSINIIIKTDTRGSKEAVIDCINKFSKLSKEVKCPIFVISSGIGDIYESDIELAANTKSMIIGLHVHLERNAALLAKQYDVEVKIYNVIYHMTKDLEEVLEKRRIIEKVWTKVGEAVVKKVFDIKGVGIIAGCYMRDGVLSRDCKVSCVRNGQVVGESKINSLQRDRKTVKEVHAGFECGFVASSFSDWQEGDTVYCYSEVKSNK